ncbi:Y-family DNA polymerase [Kushneria phosphatilytica]|uniref:Y-family DNA polymerase n=1 Tax=Kushneria phosphatilytica TaxID=657387 RepID=A0A1S1NW22_9GAMM|nr:Y-family DNA polymerase [Kushneria phosphatilytica]OHV11188.1 DNA polymerase V subunit UmuC [Kushneria phosphatilytica]QEL12243.1 Y-family DNA polymerase [Kushneria phosphatilytica]
MKGPIALVDCNNFYASCERVFEPRLQGAPVAVLSNNDGCVIARSQEVKALGIEMGTPIHHIPHEAFRAGLVLRSSNYELYGDLSARVLATLREHTPDVEPYSIDESWLGFGGFDPAGLTDYCRKMRRTVHRWTGIPVSVGIAPTRTLAKLANHYAKRHAATGGVHQLGGLDDPATRALLERTPVGDIWGIAGRIEARLAQLKIHSALDLARANPKWIRSHFSVVIERTALELAGTPCIEMLDEHESKKMIMTSRSFGRMTGDYHEIQEALRAHASRGAEKLRAQRSLTSAVMVMLKTNKHALHLRQHQDAITIALPRPTDSSFEIVRAAQQGLERIWRKGYRYQKCGAQLMDLIGRGNQQLGIFESSQSDAERQRSDKLMATLDQLNRNYGRGTVTVGMQRQEAAWQLRSNYRSNRWTTRWEELPTVKL